MATCLCDAFYDDVAAATVEVLEHLGVEVAFPEGQTCCGQPAFNGGDWVASRKVVRHTVRTFAGEEPVVVPSGSCAAMLFHGAVLEFEKERDLSEVEELGRRTWELADYIVNGLGVKTWEGRYEATVAFHQSCHSRGTASGTASLSLLESIPGLRVVPFGEGEQCCGFGGTFSIKLGDISTRMALNKCANIHASGAKVLAGGDLGCLLNIEGRLRREGDMETRVLHFAEIIAGSG